MLRDYGTIAWKDGFRAWGDRGNGCCQILRHSWRLMPKIDATKSSKLVSMKWCESSKLSSILSFFGGGKQKYILKSDLNKKTTPMSINWTWWYLMMRLALRNSLQIWWVTLYHWHFTNYLSVRCKIYKHKAPEMCRERAKTILRHTHVILVVWVFQLVFFFVYVWLCL